MELLTEIRKGRLRRLIEAQDWTAPPEDRTTGAFARRAGLDLSQARRMMRQIELEDGPLIGILDRVEGRIQLVWTRRPAAGEEPDPLSRQAARPRHAAAAIGE